MTPLAMDLYYLVTPFLPSGPDSPTIVSDHLLLGLTMQALYDNAIVVLRDPRGTWPRSSGSSSAG